MRWTVFDSPDGPLYIDTTTLCAIGPSIRDEQTTRQMRALYVMGGQCLVIEDTPENMGKLLSGTARPS